MSAIGGRLIEARSAEETLRSGPRRAQGTLERSVKVYGATLQVLRSGAEAPLMGAGSHEQRSSGFQNLKPRSAAGAPWRWSL